MIRIHYVPPSTPASQAASAPQGPGLASPPLPNPYGSERTSFSRGRPSRLSFAQVGQAGRSQRNAQDSLQLSEAWQSLASQAAGPWQVLHDATTRLGSDGRPNTAALRQARQRLRQWLAGLGKPPATLAARFERVDALLGRMLRRNSPGEESPLSTATAASSREPLKEWLGNLLPAAPGRTIGHSRRLREAGRGDAAIDVLEAAVERHPAHAGLRLELASVMTEEGHFADAEWSLSQLASEHPRAPEVQAALGELYTQMGQPLMAIEAFQHTLRLDPEHTDAHLQLGVAHYEQGDLHAAAPALQRAIMLDPQNVVARFYMAQVSLQQSDVLRARYQLGMVAKLAPELDLTRFGENAPPPLASQAKRRETSPHHWQLPRSRTVLPG